MPFKCYIYCTNGYPALWKDDKGVFKGNPRFEWLHFTPDMLNGKVIGEFICDSVLSHCEMANADLAEQLGCIRREKIREYAGEKEVFGWHISDLKIYDEPKELSEFYVEGSQTFDYPPLTKMKRPPQSWCYVEG